MKSLNFPYRFRTLALLAGTWLFLTLVAAVNAQTHPTSQTQPLEVYSVIQAQQAQTAILGSNDPKLTPAFKAQYHLTPYGAGVWKASLTDYHVHAGKPIPNDAYFVLPNLSSYGQVTDFIHLAARSVVINQVPVLLADKPWTLEPGASQESATYKIVIEDSRKQPVLEIRRTFTLKAGSYELRMHQTFRDLRPVGSATAPLTLEWKQYGQGEPPVDDVGMMGDRREFIAGYYDLGYDPNRQKVYTNNTIVPRESLLDVNQKKDFLYDFRVRRDSAGNLVLTSDGKTIIDQPASGFLADARPLWPNDKLPQQRELTWLATVNRYFTSVIYRPIPTTSASTQPSAATALDQLFPVIGIQMLGDYPDKRHDYRITIFTLATRPFELPVQGSLDLELALYAGPRDAKIFAQPIYKSQGFGELIIYNLGGFCAFCTFQWLAHLLMYFLKGIFFIVRDWGVAIIILTLIVRLLLHPLTKRSQISMTRMSKQMASLQPELEQLKKKYKDDQKKLQAETMRLYREKGVNPANMLGCLPMFLQMPIWFALYAMLYYAIERRHESAFYGIFQAVSGGHWPFLMDLSSTDKFIPLPAAWQFSIPFIGISVDGIHLLPLLMAVMFFLQQKYTTPPPANEQAAQQQKMMKWMTLLFPIFLYAAPAGLNLYIMASTAAGILDSYMVKKHIQREEEAGTFLQSKPKAPGLWTRLRQMAEERQRKLTGNQNRSYKERK